MGILGKIFGKSRPKVEARRLGKDLAQIAVDFAGEDLLNLLRADSPGKDAGDAFLALAPLSLFAWIRAAENEPLMLGSSAARQAIYQTMSSFLTIHYIATYDPAADPDGITLQISSAAYRLISVWNESQTKSPSPHWYVAKEMWFELDGSRDNPDPVKIMTMSEVMSNQTTMFLEFARQLEVVG